VGHALLDKFPGAPFAATFVIRADGFMQWSLRSEDSREDVSAIAKANGGGGHRNAAGFTQQTMLVGWDLGKEA
jgi:nanoRNase/pAp phosphatase (c-di-AMP/oligoRNAs hydrolase)